MSPESGKGIHPTRADAEGPKIIERSRGLQGERPNKRRTNIRVDGSFEIRDG